MKGFLKVSVSGVRGIVGDYFTPRTAATFCQAFGTMVGKGPVLVGRDTRTTGPMIEQAVIAGLESVGCRPMLAGVVATPTLLIAVRESGARGGVMITASHNPPEWNALKFVGRDGLFLNPSRAEDMLDLYHQDDFPQVPETELAMPGTVTDATERHFRRVRAYVDTDRIRARKFRVALDCCNGVGAVHARAFLEDLGCDVHSCFDQPTGVFGRGAEPIPENLVELTRLVREHHCEIGFAQDPDGDRLAIVDETGAPIGEDLTVALAVRQVLRCHGRGPVVVHLSTSRAIQFVAEAFGCPTYYSKVGEINVSQAMLEHGAVVGGEGNGGVIIPAIHPCRDSYAGMAVVLELLAMEGRTVTDLRAEIPAFHVLKDKVDVPAEEAAVVLRGLRRAYEDQHPSLLDGVLVDWGDRWFLARRSNTETIVRVVVEARSKPAAVELMAEVMGRIAQIRGGVTS